MNLVNTTDKLQLVTSTAASIDVIVHYVDAAASGLGNQALGRQLTSITTATTTDICAAPSSGVVRRIKLVTIQNKDASLSDDVTPLYNANGTTYNFPKQTVMAAECLEFVEALGFFKLQATAARSGLRNVSTADQAIGASATAYLTGSAILLPTTGLVAGIVLRWRVQVAKSAAATATEAYAVRFGTGGSTSDTARCSFTLDTETAVADEAIDDIECIIRGPIGASCIAQASLMRNDNLSTTGFSNTARKAQVQAVQSAAFDITPAGTIVGLSIATGASHALTVRQVRAELLNIGA